MSSNTKPVLRRLAKVATLAVISVLVPTGLAVVGAGTASAVDESNTRVVSVDTVNDRQIVMNVYSAAMDKTIPVQVILPKDRSVPRPTFYLLNGAGGGQDSATWQRQTDVVSFFADKNVNVVTPVGGKWSYYTDWIADDPVLGRNKWTTFFNTELPPLVDKQLNTNHQQAIAGLSMSGSSVLNLAIAKPGFYSAVGSYSGCDQTSDPIGQQFVKAVVETYGGGNVLNMWGPLDGPVWKQNDAYLNAEKLRGTPLYLSTGNGLPGFPNDTPLNPLTQDGRATLFPDQIIVGGGIEAGVNYCTSNMAKRLKDLNIPAVVNFQPVGTHSWLYWQDNLHESWPMIARSLGI